MLHCNLPLNTQPSTLDPQYAQEILELETKHNQLLDHVSSPLLLARKLSVTAGAILLPIRPRHPSPPPSSPPPSSSLLSHQPSGWPQDRGMQSHVMDSMYLCARDKCLEGEEDPPNAILPSRLEPSRVCARTHACAREGIIGVCLTAYVCVWLVCCVSSPCPTSATLTSPAPSIRAAATIATRTVTTAPRGLVLRGNAWGRQDGCMGEMHELGR